MHQTVWLLLQPPTRLRFLPVHPQPSRLSGDLHSHLRRLWIRRQSAQGEQHQLGFAPVRGDEKSVLLHCLFLDFFVFFQRIGKFTAKWRFGSITFTIPTAKVAEWTNAILNACFYDATKQLPTIEAPQSNNRRCSISSLSANGLFADGDNNMEEGEDCGQSSMKDPKDSQGDCTATMEVI